jgi:hypothetical protein
MTKILSPDEAYKRLGKLASKQKMSISAYAISRGVRKDIVTKWKGKHTGTIALDKAQMLGIV